MADQGDDDSEPEVFEITDFTTASEWERFIARVEEIIHDWHLENTAEHRSGQGTKLASGPSGRRVSAVTGRYRRISDKEDEWILKTEQLSFADFHFALAYHCLNNFNTKEESALKAGEDAMEVPKSLQEICDFEFDFPPRAHHLCRWHGLKEFMILCPRTSGEAITSESRAKLLWSSVGVALSNTKCEVPVFIQVQQKWRKLYYGVGISGGFRTNYEMAHLKSTPEQCSHISGLVDTFKSKLGCPLRFIPPVMVSVRFMYVIREWGDEDWPQDPPDVSSVFGDQVGYSNLLEIPCGALQDPVCDLHLAVTWPCLSEEVIVDEAEYSDLDPLVAPKWTLRARVIERCATLAYEHLKGFLELCKSSESTAQVMRSLSTDEMDLDPPVDIAQALDRLTEPVPVLSQSLTNAVSKAKSRVIKSSLSESPLPEELLNQILQLLFPDACMCQPEARKKQETLAEEQRDIEKKLASTKSKFRSLKSAPEKSLTYMLALCLCIAYYGYGGVKAVVHLWHEFVLEMRYRYENNILIPRLSLGAPNLNHCLLHQKLQMLNCCIERRKQFMEERDSGYNIPQRSSETMQEAMDVSDSKDDAYSGNLKRTSSDSEDEFFEALEEQENSVSSKDMSDKIKNQNIGKHISDRSRREGGLKETTLTLLETGQPLWIPLTQEPSPMTEDMLEEQAEIFAKLGSTEEGTKVRAQMQSASLHSDIEAFKAANAGCILEDFVRWYSPNDWIPHPETPEESEELRKITEEYLQNQTKKTLLVREQTVAEDTVEIIDVEAEEGWKVDENEEISEQELQGIVDEVDSIRQRLNSTPTWVQQGHLSLRMRMPGNLWQDVWDRAKPVPVRRQKRLFDDTKEAEKVLHFLSNMGPSDIALHLFPVLVHESVRRLKKEDTASHVAALLDQIIRNTSRLTAVSSENVDFIEEIVRQLHSAELSIARTHSLRSKFDAPSSSESSKEEIDNFIQRILSLPEVSVEGGAKSLVGKKLIRLLHKQKKPNDSGEKTKLPRPTGREYILRVTVPRPSIASRPSPQRMFAVVTPEDFRLSGAFTMDTNFI